MKAISKMLLMGGSGIGLLIVGLGYEAIEHRIVNAQSANISIAGEWTSTEGRIAFIQSGSNVSGAYEMEEGLIDGKLSGKVLTGYWSQARSILAVRCDTPRKGRYAWGRLRFVFADDRLNGAVFKGYWGYCNDEPTFRWSGVPSRSWYGAPVKPLKRLP